MRIAILGLGLIGGSIARAVAVTGWQVSAWTPSGDGPRRAGPDGVRAATSLADAVTDADLVVLAAPPLAALDLVDALAGLGSALSPETVVTDVVSTKAEIVARARVAGLRFVGGHPLAGRETSGYAAGDAELFRGRPWVIVPTNPPDAEGVARVEALVAACGAIPVRMSADDHDNAVAWISHVPLVVSAALVETAAASAEWTRAESLASSGWAGMTRLARGDVAMGTGILATNADAVAARLSDLSDALAAWADDLRQPDAAHRAERRLAAARRILDSEAASERANGAADGRRRGDERP